MLNNDRLSSHNAIHINRMKHCIDSDHDPWARSYLIDTLKQYLAAFVETIVNNSGESVHSRKYYDRAFELQLLGIRRPTPVYKIDRVDLSPRLLEELDALDPYSKTYVLHQAVARIFEDIKFELFHNITSRVLKVELV
jgi:hypothetical protein